MRNVFGVYGLDDLLDDVLYDGRNKVKRGDSRVPDNKAIMKKTVQYNVAEVEDGYRLFVTLPGVSKSDVELKVVEGDVVVTVDSKKEVVDGDLSIRSYSNAWKIPEGIDEKSIGAEMKDGILVVEFRKREKDPDISIKVK